MVDELAKLPEGDEVAILAIDVNSIDDKTAAIRNGRALWLTEFTRDRARIETALGRVPTLVAPAPDPPPGDPAKKDEKNSTQGSASVSISSDTDQKKAVDKTQAKPDQDVVETETIKAKNGAVITRTTKKDGSIDVKRVSSKGNVVVKIAFFCGRWSAGTRRVLGAAGGADVGLHPSRAPSSVWAQSRAP